MKYFATAFLALALVFTGFGSVLINGDDVQVEAKSYKSGKKGFNSNDNNSNIQKNNNDQNSSTNNNNQSKNDTTPANKGGFSAGGLMKGLFIGGLAGLLFGSLFGDMGMLGSILGFLINAAAIAVIIFLCIKIYQVMTRKKKKEETTRWNS